MEVKKMNLGHYNDMIISTNDSALSNYNSFIVGSSGSGKTTLIYKLIYELHKMGYTIVVIDTHSTFAYEKMPLCYKEYFHKNAHEIDVLKDGIRFNLLDPLLHSNGLKENPDICVGTILDIISKAYHLGVKQKRKLRSALTDLQKSNNYNSEGISAIKSAVLKDDKESELPEMLYDIINYNVFRPGNDLYQEHMINIFRVSEFNDSTQFRLAEIIISLFWRLAKNGKFMETPIYITVDECHNLPSNKPTDILPILLSEGRQHKINLMLATQIIKKDSTSEFYTRVGQSELKFFFKQPQTQATIAAQHIDSDNVSYYKQKLVNLERGRFYCTAPILLNGAPYEKPLIITNNIPDSLD